MAMERYNAPVVMECFSRVFGLARMYDLTVREVMGIKGFGENPPAGVVGFETTKEDKQRILGFVEDLETCLITAEKKVPYELTPQEDISNLFDDVRCYIDFQRKN